MSYAIATKPPLPLRAPTDKLDDMSHSSLSNSASAERALQTSQRETMSDGTILGLKDVYYQNEPDLTYYCSNCRRFISLLSLREHKAYHSALTLLKFEKSPASTAELLRRRNESLRTLKKEATVEGRSLDIKQIHLIDEAYELLKQEVEDTFESCRKIEENINFRVESFDLTCSVDFALAVGHCSDQNSRWKSLMEDTKVYQDHFGNDKNKAFVALYDSHNGKYASSVAANELHYLLLTEMAKFDPKIKCQCTFNMLEDNDIAQYDLIRPPSISSGNKRLLHRESINHIQQIVYTCEEPEHNHSHLSSHHPLNSRPSEDDAFASNSNSAHGVKDEYSRHMRSAFKRAYKLTDRVLEYGGDERSRVRWSSTSAVTVVIEQLDNPKSSSHSVKTDDEKQTAAVEGAENEAGSSGQGSQAFDPPQTVGRLHIANAGNSQAVLVRDNRPYLLTKPHSYSNTKERNRIISAGGRFSKSEKEMRVNGVSLTTRALGNHGDPVMKQLISWEPYCTTVPVDQYAQLLIIATHGVWQVFSPQEAAELLLQVLPQNRIPTPGYISPSVDKLTHVRTAPPTPIDDEADEIKSRVDHPPSTVQDDEFAEEVIRLPGDETPLQVTEQKSNMSVAQDAAVRKSKDRSGSVTFRDDVKSAADNTQEEEVVVQRISADRKQITGAESLIEAEEDELADIKSVDSGNEADVDTDWASTLPPHETALGSALSTSGNPYRHLSRVLSERLVQSALLAGAKDNISAIVVVLPGTKIVEVLEE